MATATTAEPTSYRMFIGGRWSDSSDGGQRPSIDPYSGRTWASIPEATPADVARAVEAARAGLSSPAWAGLTGKERGRLLRRLADLVRHNVDRLAVVETTDNGKLLREMSGQVAAVADWYEYFAGWADKLQGDVIPTDKPNFLVYTRPEPVGVVAAITAWNSPLLLLSFKSAAALAAGCTIVAKPAEQAPVSTLVFAELVEEAGFPEGVFNVVTGGREVGEALTSNPGVDLITFTGSTPTGIAVAHSAADHLAEVSLELGGKSANIVFDDADLDAAVPGAVAGIYAAGGQTCIAGSRLLVHEAVQEEFLERFAAQAGSIKLGDPIDADTQMGPLAFPEQHQKVLRMIGEAREDGARLVTGGEVPGGELRDGLFVEPTILADVDPSMRIAREEVFGPVAAITSFADEEEALAIANGSEFGLAAGVWTKDVGRAHRMAARLQAGTVWINAYRVMTQSVPFGGVKMSGYGRENGRQGIEAFTRPKAIWVEIAGQTRDPFKLG